MAMVILSALVEKFSVSRMHDFSHKVCKGQICFFFYVENNILKKVGDKRARILCLSLNVDGSLMCSTGLLLTIFFHQKEMFINLSKNT